MRRGAVDGEREPVSYQGRIQFVWKAPDRALIASASEQDEHPPTWAPEGTVRTPFTVAKRSDALLMFLAKGEVPEFRSSDVMLEHRGTIKHDHEHNTSEQLDARLREIASRAAPPPDPRPAVRGPYDPPLGAGLTRGLMQPL